MSSTSETESSRCALVREHLCDHPNHAHIPCMLNAHKSMHASISHTLPLCMSSRHLFAVCLTRCLAAHVAYMSVPVGQQVCIQTSGKATTCSFDCLWPLTPSGSNEAARWWVCPLHLAGYRIDEQLPAGHGHLIVATATQCCIYSLAHMSTPHVMDWKETPNLILHADRYHTLHVSLSCFILHHSV